MRIIVIALILAGLVGCDGCKAKQKVPEREIIYHQVIEDEVPPTLKEKVVERDEDRGCEWMPKLTNDEIINETNKCKAAGLDAQSLKCGQDFQIIIIQCKPKG